MAQMKTPGVYIVEKNAFPNSIVQVATAVPAFIGYTEKAQNVNKSLKEVPWRISSLNEYHTYFGGGYKPSFSIAKKPEKSNEATDFTLDGTDYLVTEDSLGYLMYSSMQAFFQNGGGDCYVVSVGSYDDNEINADKLREALDLLLKEQEPTLIVIPETVRLAAKDSITVQQAMLEHCGDKMRNRFAVLDIWDGWRTRHDPAGDPVEGFRDALGINFLDFGAAYYPWIDTTIYSDRAFTYESVSEETRPLLQQLIRADLGLPAPDAKDEGVGRSGGGDTGNGGDAAGGGQVPAKVKLAQQQQQQITAITSDWKGVAVADVPTQKAMLDQSLRTVSPLYSSIMTEVASKMNRLPPAAAMVGVYTMVDSNRGVWKAPANVSLNSVVAPTLNISNDDQEDLNVTPQGKSINAIRPFIGEGVLVWGARTLDGNSLDWRYISVRRTMIMIEESIRLASKAYVFEPNTANTWTTMRSMIGSFLTSVWSQGGLAGAVPEDAFSVHVGLGETMTPNDILEGILRITVLVAVTRPAEFIEITFQQQQQRS